MLFNSLEFVVFFPVVVAVYFLLPHRYRWPMLLAASYYFYACWKVEYLLLIVLSTVVDYWAALQMGKRETRAGRRPFLFASLGVNLGLLFTFKYFNFFNESLRFAFGEFNIFYGVPALDVLLPVGISFYTFQTLSYSIDVYRGQKEPERHLGIFALYVAFFPQLVAGPIERSTRLLPQFTKRVSFDRQRVGDGLRLMLWGFFKKVVIADRLAIYVNEVYNNPGVYEGGPVIIATYFFAFQIFCDFSGYSDIAIGAARVMGYDLMDNFRRPYFSKSIGEFWKRWHISLSTWFRDYLYIPLGGNRVVKWRWYMNLFLVFVISGLWHGANWTFVLWGALHGGYLIGSIVFAGLRNGVWKRLASIFGKHTEPLRRAVAMVTTFHLVLLAWVFFRANSIQDAFGLLGQAAKLRPGTIQLTVPGFGMYELAIAILMLGVMELVHVLQRQPEREGLLSSRPIWIRWPAYYLMIFCILMFGEFSLTEFIYFQF